MDMSQYLDVFIDESSEHLEVLYNRLLALEKNPEDKSIIEEIFRAAHTLKGMSATMGFEDIANLTHQLENVFDAIRNEKVKVEAVLIDTLFEAVDYLHAMVEDISNGGSGKKDVQPIVDHLTSIVSGQPQNTTKLKNTETDLKYITKLDEFELSILTESSDRGFSNYEIFVELNDDCLLKGARVFMVFDVLEKHGEVIKSEPPVTELEDEEFQNTFTVILVSKHPGEKIAEKIKKVSEIKEVSVNPFSLSKYMERKQVEELAYSEQAATVEKTANKEVELHSKGTSTKTIRVNIDRLDVLMNLFEELVIDRGRLEQIAADSNNHDLLETVERMTRVSSDLQSIILTMRMVPIDQVFSRFPRMIRKLARELDKKIDIDIIGADTELDRTVIDEIGDPLVHLLRNAVDHGIEMPEERKKKGKPEHGTIQLEAYHSGNHVFIEIRDDGAGIDKDRVVSKAISNEVIKEEDVETLSDQQIFELILESGFSTADTISDISGRGVGLDVVKNTIESLGGHITIHSEIEKGSTFSIQLPLTLSIISVLLVEIKTEKYAIPLSSIIETAIIHKDQMLSAHNKKVIDFRGKVVPLTFLEDIFHIPDSSEKDKSDYVSVVIVKKGEKLAGLVVDSFIGQQEVVLKSLGDYLGDTFAISGATILGDGEVALIIDSNALVK